MLADMPMYDLLRVFQTGHSHMVLLRKPSGQSVWSEVCKPSRHAESAVWQVASANRLYFCTPHSFHTVKMCVQGCDWVTPNASLAV